jgi:CRISPR-associated protein Csb1
MTPLDVLLAAPRVKVVADLAPIAGTRFQPTGFPDLGAAVYQGPDGRDMLLVESAQSMANRLEAQLWDPGANRPRPPADRLPSIEIRDDDGAHLTSSRTESHRLASAYVKAATIGGQAGVDLLTERLGLVKGRPIDHRRVYEAVYELDPLSLVHGVFFADEKWFGQPKIARAVTAFVEAAGVTPAHSGGVKFDHVSNKGDVASVSAGKKGSEEGYGNVPFPRTEFVAESIQASFVVDTHQIRGYGLGAPRTTVLLALALLEISRLLDDGLRLRTACDLEATDVRVERPAGASLPSQEELVAAIEAGTPGGEQPPLRGVLGV